MKTRNWKTTLLGYMFAGATIFATPAALPGALGTIADKAIPQNWKQGAAGVAALLGAFGFQMAADKKQE